MFNRLNKTATIVVTIMCITTAIILFAMSSSYFKRIDLEISDFFAGFFFSLGLVGLVSVFSKFKKENK